MIFKKMGCFTSLCDDQSKDKDLEEENGQFEALFASGNTPNPNTVAKDYSDDAIPLFAPAPSDDDIIMSSDSEIEEESQNSMQEKRENEN